MNWKGDKITQKKNDFDDSFDKLYQLLLQGINKEICNKNL